MRDKLKETRLKFGFTQEKMSQLTGIERTKYTRIENGSIKKVTIDDAFLISKVLMTTIEDIFLPKDVYDIHAQNDQAPTGTEG